MTSVVMLSFSGLGTEVESPCLASRSAESTRDSMLLMLGGKRLFGFDDVRPGGQRGRKHFPTLKRFPRLLSVDHDKLIMERIERK